MASGQQQSMQQQGGTYFQDPAFIQRLLDSLGGQQQQFNAYLSNPTASPLYTNQLRGLLASLAPQEAASRQAYTDAGVAAGNRSSGRFAQGAANLEGNILRNQQSTAGQLLGQNFGQMTQALLAAMGLTPQLLQALKMQQSSSSSQGTGWNDAGGGGMGGGGGGGGGGLQFSNPGAGGGYFNTPGYGRGQPDMPGSQLSLPYSSTGMQPNTSATPSYDPNAWMSGSTYLGANGDYIMPGGPGGWNPSQQQQDEWGFTPQDWQNDPYFQ
jgi:hypothetical protein